MASLIWLLTWLVNGRPDLEWFGTWNDWAVALVVCAGFDLFNVSAAELRTSRRR